MRIVIDLQAVQGSNGKRGIGRYSLSLAKAMVRNRGDHEIFIVLNGLFPDTIEPIRGSFDGLLPQENIHVWHAVAPVRDLDRANDWRRQSAEMVREALLARLKPDIVHVTSLFEGLVDDVVTSIGEFSNPPTAVTLYDLIPLIHRHPYLDNPALEAWYLKKLDHFRRADLWLSISESSRQEGLAFLGLPDHLVVNVSTAADAHFQTMTLSQTDVNEIRRRYGIPRPFVMYTGGIDHRKNIEGLIRAFSLLPLKTRRDHQLAIVCAAREEDKQRLLDLAKKKGLSAEDLIFTGFIPEDDLVALYNLCKLFVFPSWHEGFGLPALEAMHCGAPVIGAKTSSLPEVIGWDGALFDPHSDDAIAAAMEHGLCDESFRAALTLHGKEQAAKFSWDTSAKNTFAAFERFHAERLALPVDVRPSLRRPKLAYVSPLPPVRSGIADYSAELIPELSRHYQIELIAAQSDVNDAQVKACWPIRTTEWFAKHADQYDRVLYHFGNSEFHHHMFDLLAAIPGVVMLHDFFLSGVVSHMDVNGGVAGTWAQSLYHSHGYCAVRERFHVKDTADVVWKYPCNLNVLQNSLGVLVHSEYSRHLASQWYGGSDHSDWTVIPLMRQFGADRDRSVARAALGFNDDDFVVCSFGVMGPSKLNHRLLAAWLNSKLHPNANCYLIFVGENHPAEYGKQIIEQIRYGGADFRVRISGWADTENFRQYLAAADIGVQLRALSRGETSAAVLDCMNYGLATIVNANGSMADLPDRGVLKLPDMFTDGQLVEALEVLWQDRQKRIEIGIFAKEVIHKVHNPRRCADMYYSAIERYYRTAAAGINALPSAIADLEIATSDAELRGVAEAIVKTVPVQFRGRQLLVDVSELVQRDSRSGIQRVVRNILWEWLINPPAGFRIEPVYAATEVEGYRYARKFSFGFIGCPTSLLNDERIEFAPGDIFVGLDLQPHIVPAQEAFYQEMRRQGVSVKFVVYDLLPILQSDKFVDGAAEGHALWLKVVAQSDGAVCISQSVADELRLWTIRNPVQRERPFSIDSFHLGADLENSSPSVGLPDNINQILGTFRSRPTFLSVGTIEPRKGQVQTLTAFELLWQAGYEMNLLFVGKQGWMVEHLVQTMRSHPELGKRLFWLEGISDEYLEKIYSASDCLIAASEGEGFGLPLIEAAQHKLSIIARDIPVFREVAGQYAHYFSGTEASDLARSILDWLMLYKADGHPKSDTMPWLTWRESAEQLLKRVLPER